MFIYHLIIFIALVKQTYSGTGPALLDAACMPAVVVVASGAGIFLAALVDKAAQGQCTQECVVSRSSVVWAFGFVPES